MALSEKWNELCQLIVRTNLQNLDYSTAEMLDHLGQLILDFDKDQKNENLRDEIKSELKKLNIVVYLPSLENKEIIRKTFHEFFTLFTETSPTQAPTSIAALPADTLMNIADDLPSEDLASMSRVSKRFHAVANNQTFWQRIIYSNMGLVWHWGQTKKSYAAWYAIQYLGKSRRLFSLIYNNDLQGLKAVSHLITIDSLYELNKDRKTYLDVAQDKGHIKVFEFIVETLQGKANTEYLQLKLSIGLGYYLPSQSNSKLWQNLAQHFGMIRSSDDQPTKLAISDKQKCKLAKLIVEHQDLQALLKLLGDIRVEGKNYSEAVTLASHIARDYYNYGFGIMLTRKHNILNIKFIDTLLSWLPNNEQRIFMFLSLILESLVRVNHLYLVKHIIEGLAAKDISFGPRILTAALCDPYPNGIETIKYLLEPKANVNTKKIATLCLLDAFQTDLRHLNPEKLTLTNLLVEAGATYPPSPGTLGCLAALANRQDQKIISTILTYFKSKFVFKINELRSQYKGQENSTLLELSLRARNYILAFELLKEECDINQKAKYGQTLLRIYVDGILRFDYLKSVSSDDRFEKSIDTFHLLLRRGADPDLPIISDFSGSVLTSENMLTTKSLCKKNKHLACARIMLDAFQARAEFNNFMKPNADDAEKCIKKAISSDAGLTYLFMRDLVANPDIALERKQQLFDHYQNSGLIEKYKLNVLGKFLVSKAPSCKPG